MRAAVSISMVIGVLLISSVPLVLATSVAAGPPPPPGTNTFEIAFKEKGLPANTNWSVSLNGGSLHSSNTSQIIFKEKNGTYAYLANATGYSASPSSGNVTMHGGYQSRTITFTALPKDPIQHVVVIVMENGARKSILAASPYQRYLSATFGSVPNYYGLCHASPPNYFAFTSGRMTACSYGKVQNVANIPDTLQAADLTWSGYFESMPTNCDQARSPNGLYVAADHNPFLRYTDIVTNASRCKAYVVNSQYFNASVASGTLPSFSFYVPNQYDDCHTDPPGVSNYRLFCDNWLKGFLAPILNHTGNYSGLAEQTLISHTAFIIAYDEGAGTSYAGYEAGGVVNSYCVNNTGMDLTACGGPTYVSVVSPYSDNTTFTANSTDFNVASTIEWLLGIGSDGGYDGTPGYFPAWTSLFNF
jgi:Phosphoesterase family